jgi:hypothetical protein
VGDSLRDGIVVQRDFLVGLFRQSRKAVESVIEADPVATAVRTMMAAQTEWTGTASELLGALEVAAGERTAKSKAWPDGPRGLSGRLRRAATFLRKTGIDFNFDKKQGRARNRMIEIVNTHSLSATENAGAQPSAPSAPSAPMRKFIPTNSFAAARRQTVANDADGSGKEPVATARAKSLKSNAGGAADGADANITRLSGTPESDGTC